jgi:sucrose-6-phosphate hydrolase SacC (GH32 family)
MMTDTPTRPTDPPAEWLTFHLTHPSPEEPAGDPNAIFFWAGRYHFHYVYPREGGLAYAHVSSPDLVHWTWHPTVLTPTVTGHGMLSGGGFVTKEGRPAIIYASVRDDAVFPVQIGRAQIVHALDDQLDSWSAPAAIEPRVRPDADPEIISPWDPHGWLEGDTYYAIFGSQPPHNGSVTAKKATVHKSADLVSWEYVGPLLSKDLPEAEHDWDISCPDFFPLGREHMLLCISHNLGCRYYLGEWKDEKFTPTRHGRMNWQASKHATADGSLAPDGGRAVFFAPETLLTPDGRRVMWAWCWIDGLQHGIQSLPRELSLPEDGVLRIAPVRELEMLRSDEVRAGGIEVPSTGIQIVDEVTGDALECAVTFRCGSAGRFGVVVLCDVDGVGGLPIAVDTGAETLAIGDIAAPFVGNADSVTLRVFVDKGMVEVFADDRQAMIASHDYRPENVHVGLFADDRITVDLAAWRLTSIYAKAATDERGRQVAR